MQRCLHSSSAVGMYMCVVVLQVLGYSPGRYQILVRPCPVPDFTSCMYIRCPCLFAPLWCAVLPHSARSRTLILHDTVSTVSTVAAAAAAETAGLHPLAQLEAFNLNSMTWHSPLPAMTPQGLTPQCHDLGVSPCTDTLNPDTQPSLLSPEGGVWGARCSSLSSSCSFRIGIKSGPSPRGQPAAASNTAGTALYLFGGWDGQQRYNDLWKLHVQGNSRQPAVQGTSSQPATQGNSSQPIVQGNSSQPAVQGNNDWAQAGSLDPTSTNQQQWFWQLVQPSRFTAAADCDAAAACEVGEGVADGAEVIDAAPCPRADHVMVSRSVSVATHCVRT